MQNSLKGQLLAIVLVVLAGCRGVSPTGPHEVTVAPRQAGELKISVVDGMVLAYVPAGDFIMGSTQGLTDEQPAHKVYLDAYWVDRTEITNALYGRCVEAGKCEKPSVTTYYNDSTYEDHPVEYVSWQDAVNYCTWAERRLPTEAEWEKVAAWDPNVNQQRVYPWGDEYDCSKGNFDDEVEMDASLMQLDKINCDGFVRSSPVGYFSDGASAYGVFDLGGNVWEWVQDAFLEVDAFTGATQNYYAISPYENPPGVDPALTDYRLMRGGSYNLTFGFGRAAYRLWYGLNDKYEGVGFRCALSEE